MKIHPIYFSRWYWSFFINSPMDITTQEWKCIQQVSALYCVVPICWIRKIFLSVYTQNLKRTIFSESRNWYRQRVNNRTIIRVFPNFSKRKKSFSDMLTTKTNARGFWYCENPSFCIRRRKNRHITLSLRNLFSLFVGRETSGYIWLHFENVRKFSYLYYCVPSFHWLKG